MSSSITPVSAQTPLSTQTKHTSISGSQSAEVHAPNTGTDQTNSHKPADDMKTDVMLQKQNEETLRIQRIRERKLHEKEMKHRRGELESIITQLNAECGARFSNPDKNLHFLGIVKVFYTRGGMDESKSIIVTNQMTCLQVVEMVIKKFAITTNQDLYSLHEVDAEGVDKAIADTDCLVDVMIQWGVQLYPHRSLKLDFNTKKCGKGQRQSGVTCREAAAAIDEVNSEQVDRYTAIKDSMKQLKDQVAVCCIAIKPLLALKEQPTELKTKGQPLIVAIVPTIKQVVATILQHVPVTHDDPLSEVVHMYRTSLTDALKNTIVAFKVNCSDPSDDSCAQVINNTHTVNTLVALADQIVLGVTYTKYIVDSTAEGFGSLSAEQSVLTRPRELGKALSRYAGLTAKVVVTAIGRGDDDKLVELLLRAIKTMSRTLKSSPDYVLKRTQLADISDHEAMFEDCIRTLIVSIKVNSGFWPPPDAQMSLIAAATRVVCQSCCYLYQVQRHSLLRSVVFDSTNLLDEEAIMRSHPTSPSRQSLPTPSGVPTQGLPSPIRPTNGLPLLCIPTDRATTPPLSAKGVLAEVEDLASKCPLKVPSVVELEYTRKARYEIFKEMDKRARANSVQQKVIPIEQQSKELIDNFNINSSICDTMQEYMKQIEMEVTHVAQVVRNEQKEKYKSASETMFNAIRQTMQELDGLETSALDDTVSARINQAVYAIASLTHKVHITCMISTGVWPPADSRAQFLSAVKRSADVVRSMVTTLHDAIAQQTPRIDELKERAAAYEKKKTQSNQMKNLNLCLSNDQDTLLCSPSVREMPEPAFAQLLAFPLTADIIWENAPLSKSVKPSDTDTDTSSVKSSDTADTQTSLTSVGSDTDVKTTPALPRVTGGSLKALVLRLTFHEHIDPEFWMAFHLSMSSFTTPHEFMDLLIIRYNRDTPPGLSQKQKAIWSKEVDISVKLRIFCSLKQWVTLAVDDFQNDAVLKTRFDTFVELIAKDLPNAAKNLREHMKKCYIYGANSTDPMATYNLTIQQPPPKPLVDVNFKKISNVTDIDPLEVARQLTMVEWDIFRKIKPKETMSLSWNIKEKQHLSRNILNMINRANEMAIWVATLILQCTSTKKRVNTIKYLVTLAEKCLELNNFNSVFTIVASLSSSSITRLKKTWAEVPDIILGALDALKQLVSDANNYKVYRTHLQGLIDTPCIPFLGIYLTDLTFIEEGNPDKLPGGQINFNKRRIFAGTITQILDYQKNEYNFTVVNGLRWHLTHLFLSWNEDGLYKQSLLVEPRQN